MSKKRTSIPGIPSRGMILSHLLTEILDQKAVDRLRDPGSVFENQSQNDVHQRLRRWRTQTGLSPDEVEKLERVVFDIVLQADEALAGEEASPASNGDARRESFWKNYRRRAEFRCGPGGESEQEYPADLDRTELAQLLIKFLEWNDGLRELLGEGFNGESARYAWMTAFVLPWIAVQFSVTSWFFRTSEEDNRLAWDSGMPAGLHWYLPQSILRLTSDRKGTEIQSFRMPCPQVLEWWEDLFGRPLRGVTEAESREIGKASEAEILERVYGTQGKADTIKDARKELAAWREGSRPMSWVGIMKWTRKDLDWTPCYAGVFRDDATRPMSERLLNAAGFLREKRRRFEEDKTYPVFEYDCFPDSDREVLWLSWQLRSGLDAEPLARLLREPGTFSDDDFANAFLDRVKERWAVPSNLAVRRRLMLAAAMQRLFSAFLGSVAENPNTKESSRGYGAADAEDARAGFVHLAEATTRVLNACDHVVGSPVGKRRYTARWIAENYVPPEDFPQLRHSLLGAFDPDCGPQWFCEALLATKATAAAKKGRA